MGNSLSDSASAALHIQISTANDVAAIDEIVAHVEDRPLEFPFCLRAVRPASSRREAPLPRKAEGIEIVHDLGAHETQVFRDYCLHLIEQQLLWNAAERGERLLKTAEQRAHVLAS